ncbi:MAG: glycosyltransferase [Chloroflexi bacterium]|nr:glycosyltransferase [Chloroflexota bacterium]
MALEYEETIEHYKRLDISIVGIPKDKIPRQANPNLSDAELVAFYSERYVDVDVAEFLTKERRERLHGLCNLVKPGEFYLHVGYANGAHMQILYQRGISGIGLDLSVPNILRGREKYPHLRFIHGFAEEIPFKDNYFDIVILGDVIEHFRNPKVALAECLRVAKKGLVLCVPIKPEITEAHINPFSCAAILNLLKFYKLKVHFYDCEGRKISRAEAEAKLEAFPWLLIRAEKTVQTDVAVKGVMDTEGKAERGRAVAEILGSDEWCYNTEHQRDETHLNRFRLLSHLIEGQKVLEMGCGNGDLSLEIARLGFDVVGIDISEPGIHQAVELVQKENLDAKAQFMVMDATSLEFPDNSFDTILIAEVLEHVRDSRKLLEEAVRVVRNGGRIIVSVPDGLSVPFPGHLRVLFKDTMTTELSQYAEEITWHELPFKKWLICSFFVKKTQLDITEGPLVDIMMPTYNGRKYIRNAIKSVINQTYRNWNLVVVNDGGEDVADIIDEFHDSRIKYIVAEHKGKAHALNVGIRNSSGEFIGYLDDDDILYPLHLEVLIKAALQGKDYVYSDWYEVSLDENNREIGREFEFRQDVAPWMLIPQNYINHKCVLHSRSLFEKAGMYDEELDVLIDWDVIRRLSFICPPYHVWSVTSERIRYYSGRMIDNRITGIWARDPDKAGKSMERIVNKTYDLSATVEELKEAITKAMLSPSYYHKLDFDNVLQTKDAKITDLSNSLQAKDTQINELNGALQTKDTQINELNGALQAKDTQINELNGALQTKDTQINELNGALQTKDTQINELNGALQTKDTQINELNGALQAKDTQINELNGALQTKDTQINELNGALQAKDTQINELEAQMQQIQRGIIMQLVSRYQRVIGKLLRPGTRRRYYYELGLVGIRVILNQGWRSFFLKFGKWLRGRIFNIHPEVHQIWIAQNEPKLEDLEAQRQESVSFRYRPKISVIMPVWNTHEKWLRSAIESVLDQTYDNWELCIADGNSTKPHIKQVLREYAKKDARIRLKFLSQNKGTAGNSNEALSLATGEFIGFLDHDDELVPFALYEVAKLLNNQPEADFVYSDEVLMCEKGIPFYAMYRPGFSLDYLLSHPYIVHFVVIRAKLVQGLNGFREDFATSHDYDLFLRIISKTRGVIHIPKVLYRWREHPSSAGHIYKGKVMELSKKALVDFLNREGIEGNVYDGKHFNFFRVKRRILNNPKVSIIIPTRDKEHLLRQCIESIENKTTYRNYEVLIVDNLSQDIQTAKYLDYVKAKYANYKCLKFVESFNFSRLNNYAAKYTQGEHLLFLNNDIEVISPEWIEAMLEHSQREEVAFVGAKLLFPDNKIQHVGVVIGLFDCCEHVYKRQDSSEIGYMGHFISIRNWSAVTAACMMVKKEVFDRLGGFDENMKVGFGDIDFCLRAVERGYLNVYTPYAELYHHESATRGNTVGKPFGFDPHPEDSQYFKHRWNKIIKNGDPYYNPNLPLDSLDLSSYVEIGRYTNGRIPSTLDKELIPSPELSAFVGDGDFRIIGEEFFGYFKNLCYLMPNETVLDVGCGIGRMAVPLTKYLDQNGRYEGFDTAKKGIDWSNEHISSKYSNFHFQLVDIFNKQYNPEGKVSASEFRFPFEDEFFNFVFLASVFTHMLPKDIEHYLAEIYRVLKKGGRCLITFFLLNNESLYLIQQGKSTIEFKYGEGTYRWKYEETPENAVAYSEEYMRTLYAKGGLMIKEPIQYGSWCGRERFLSYQDIVIAEKL